MSKLTSWIIVICLIIVILGIAFLKKYLFKRRNEKIKKDYDEGVAKINADIDEKVKHDTAEGQKRAEEIRAQAIADSKKQE